MCIHKMCTSLERYHREETRRAGTRIPIRLRLHGGDQFRAAGGSKYHQDQTSRSEVLPEPKGVERGGKRGASVLPLRGFS